MIGALTLYNTMIGKKVIMAVTGFMLFGYLVLHWFGNLKLFAGAEAMNAYGIGLRELGYPILGHEQALWLVRIILGAALILHIWAAFQLTRLDLASRPVGYAQRRPQTSSYAARTMRWGGVILGLFIIYHILHLTTGTVHPKFGGHAVVYTNVVVGFQNPLVSLVYIVAMVALGFHLYHGVWSFGQTLGWRSAANDHLWRGAALLSAIIIGGGNIAFPLAVLSGVVR